MALPDRDPPPMPERYSTEERERQEALNRSWRTARRDMADPQRRTELEAVIAEIDSRSPVAMTAARHARQEALNASWAAVQADMADPARRAHLEAALAEVDAAPPGPALTRDEFLARVTGTGA